MIAENIVEQAQNTNIVEFIGRYYGFSFKENYGSFRCKEHPSLAIARDCRGWAWHSQDLNGYGAISFLMKVEGFRFPNAVEEIVGYSVCQAPIYVEPEPIKVLQLPQRALNQEKLWHYMCEVRKLDPAIVSNLLEQGLIYQDNYNNVVFVGLNQKNVPKFACVRGTNPLTSYRKDCLGSDKAYSFHMTYSESHRLYVFESPIDCISHGSFENLTGDGIYNQEVYRKDNRLSLGGTSSKALDSYLKRFPQVRELVFCLDNDTVGGEQSVKFARSYYEKGYETRIELPTHKDYNEMLVLFLEERRLEHERCDSRFISGEDCTHSG